MFGGGEEYEKLSDFQNGCDYCIRDRFGGVDPNFSAGYSHHCNLLYPCVDHGDCDCKIYIRGECMQIVVVRAPKMLRGLLMKIFKIHK
jgi:hypothetical protein